MYINDVDLLIINLNRLDHTQENNIFILKTFAVCFDFSIVKLESLKIIHFNTHILRQQTYGKIKMI